MKVLLINGSPHKNGCTYTALKEIADQLAKEGAIRKFIISERRLSVLVWLAALVQNSANALLMTKLMNL